ncbi:MAG: FlgD immunoglobulin-like domain containing protein [Candidatus Cloacimonas sp.]|nr:FlgD immunoglobulin-like domain containing protein [Candidatus Cloacimonas sp.]
MPAGNDFIAIAGGGWHSVALKSDGSLVAWGWNDYGQCNVPTGNDYVAIAAGGYHSVALRSNGTLVVWGANDYGQCNVPQGNDFVAIAAGGDDDGYLPEQGLSFSLALKSDGSVVAWGNNAWGQCNVPQRNDYVAISAGSNFSVALVTNNPSGIEDDSLSPVALSTISIYPNPFYTSTTISYALNKPSKYVELGIYNIRGQLVRKLVNEPLTSGQHTAIWDGKDDKGNTLATGMYLCRISSAGKQETHKMLLMK